MLNVFSGVGSVREPWQAEDGRRSARSGGPQHRRAISTNSPKSARGCSKRSVAPIGGKGKPERAVVYLEESLRIREKLPHDNVAADRIGTDRAGDRFQRRTASSMNRIRRFSAPWRSAERSANSKTVDLCAPAGRPRSHGVRARQYRQEGEAFLTRGLELTRSNSKARERSGSRCRSSATCPTRVHGTTISPARNAHAQEAVSIYRETVHGRASRPRHWPNSVWAKCCTCEGRINEAGRAVRTDARQPAAAVRYQQRPGCQYARLRSRTCGWLQDQRRGGRQARGRSGRSRARRIGADNYHDRLSADLARAGADARRKSTTTPNRTCVKRSTSTHAACRRIINTCRSQSIFSAKCCSRPSACRMPKRC